MKKIFMLLLILSIGIGFVHAQNPETIPGKAATLRNSDSDKNLLKINLLSLPLKNFSFGYEHILGRKITAGLGLRFMPNGSLPLRSVISNLIDDPEADRQLDKFETGNIAITPEIRFYMGKQALQGFYIAPFARYSSYSAKLPFEFDVEGTTETIPLSGKLNTFTGGLLLGAQWKLGGRIYLDWWMLGPQYGSAKGNLDGKKSLTTQEQLELRDELQDIEIPFADTKTTVDANGARLDITGPWAGLRAGLCLGIRF